MQDSLRYDVFVGGMRAGLHTVDFTPNGAGYTAKSAVSIRVGAAFLTAYEFEQYGNEQWESGEIVRFDYVTHDGGTTTKVSGTKTGDKLLVDSPRRRGMSLPLAATPSFWNPDILKFENILNPQTGKLERLSAQPVVGRKGKLNSRVVEGEGYAVQSFFKGEIWFDAARRSQGFWFEKGGYRVDILRTP